MDTSHGSTFQGGQPLAIEPKGVPDSPDHHEGSQSRTVRGFRWALAILALYSSNFLYGMDASIAANIQAPVAQTFADISKLGWLGVGFMLGSVIFTLPLGKAYAVFDTKWMYISCLVMFAAGSALCGGAPSMNAIIIGRVWAGAGGAGMYLGNINYIAALTSPSETLLYMASTGLSFGVGLILGPVIGGAFADSSATWRWAFYINLVIMAAVSPLYFLILPSVPRRPGTTFVQRIKTIDWLGFLLSAAAYITFTLFVTLGGVQWAWHDGRTIACIIFCAVSTVAFALTQAFSVLTTPDNRIFPCEMVFHKGLVALFVAIATSSGSLFIILYYIPLFFQFVYNADGLQSAVHLLPTELIYVAVSVFCGQFMPRVGWVIYWYILSGVFLLVGAVLMHTVHVSTSVGSIYGFTVLLSLGFLTSQASYGVGPTMVETHRIPEVLQFLNVAQVQGLLFSLTIASAVFQNECFAPLQSLFAPLGYSDTDIRNAIAGTKSEILIAASPKVRAQALDVIASAIDDVYIMVIAAAAVHIAFSFMLPHKK